MAKKSKLVPPPVAPVPSTKPPVRHEPFFPFARYCSIVGVQSTLLLFVAFFLPRSAFQFELTRPAIDPTKLSSRDRPQDPFLDDLTASPILTVLSICLGVAVLQNWWAGWLRKWSLDYRFGEEGNDSKQLEKAKFHAGKTKALAKAWAATFCASLVFFFILVLFGAPVNSHLGENWSLSMLLSILSVLPPAYTLGIPTLGSERESLFVRFTWLRLFAELNTRTALDRALVYPSVCALIGSWFGSIPIALDWDRPWQAWPLTPAFGSIFGFIAGSLIALTISAVLSLAEENISAAKQKAQ